MDSLLPIFLTIFGTAASVSGVVIYVFNGTRKLIGETHKLIGGTHKLIGEMHQTQREIKELLVKMDERSAKMDERADERHREVVELIARKV